MSEAAVKPVWLFYSLQGEKGENQSRPNACQIAALSPDRVTLAEVLSSFTLRGTGSFHFRFQQDVDGQPMFVDVVDPAEAVPRVGGNIVARVLRLDNVKCASRNSYQLRLRSEVIGRQRQPTSSATPTAAAPPVLSRPAAVARDNASVVAPVATPKPAAVPSPAPRPASPPAPPIVVPEHVDKDLADKSDFVKAEVMRRRNEARAAEEAAVAEVEAREASQRAEAEGKDAARAKLGPKLAEWAQEPSGRKKDIRALLATMQTILWEGAKWEGAPMSKLLIPDRVKVYYMRAIRIVHPDKHNTMDVTQRYIAETIFHALETAYRHFQEAEMGSGSASPGPTNTISSL